MNRADYRAYLGSEYWLAVARLVKERDGGCCVLCGSRRGLQVHHRTYERFPYQEQLTDLTTLCGKCHTMYHNAKGRADA